MSRRSYVKAGKLRRRALTWYVGKSLPIDAMSFRQKMKDIRLRSLKLKAIWGQSL